MPAGRFYSSAVSLNGEIFVIGGATGKTNSTFTTNLVLKYSPSTNAWTTATTLPTALHSVGVVTLNNKIYVIGGGDAITVFNKVQVYDPAADNWTTRAVMPTARDVLSVIVYDGKIYAIGGIVNNNPFTASTTVEVYDPTTDSWSTTASLNQARYDQTAVILNGTIYVYGGSGINSVEKYIIKEENPEPSINRRALLTIYISGGQIKEYDLSAAELNAFIAWYDSKDAGVGPAKFAFTKTWNKGPFMARTEYVIFDKILTFDVDEYNSI